MGNTISSWGGKKKVQGIINNSGLPLQIDDNGPEDSKGPLSPFTEAYPVKGWFTGVRSKVTIAKPRDVVYRSLSKDLHKVFTPMTECDDEIEEEDGGRQVIFRVVRIPFKVAFVTGNLKLRLHVNQDSRTGEIHFESVKEGRLITQLVADFDITPKEGSDSHTVVTLDAKINAQSLPPAPFKNMVKDVMVRKMDACMTDLVDYHSKPAPGGAGAGGQILADGRAGSAPLGRRNSRGILAALRRSLGRRPSLERGAAGGGGGSASRRGSIDPARDAGWQSELNGAKSTPAPKPEAEAAAVEESARAPTQPAPEPAAPTSGVPAARLPAAGGQADVFRRWQAQQGVLSAA